MKKRVLGDENPLNRGDFIDAVTEHVPTTGERVMEIPVLQVREISNMRKGYDETSIAELAASIKAQGQLHPITVAAAADGFYDILYGHRRYRAMVMLSQTEPDRYLKIKCLVKRQGEFDPKTVREKQIVENLQREDPKGWEVQEALEEMRTNGDSIQQIAKKIGKSEGSVKNMFMAVKALRENPEVDALVKSHAGVTLADLQEVRVLSAKQQVQLITAKINGEINTREELRHRVAQVKAAQYETGRDDRMSRKRFEVLNVRPDGTLKVKSFLIHRDKLDDNARERLRELIDELQKLLNKRPGKGGKK